MAGAPAVALDDARSTRTPVATIGFSGEDHLLTPGAAAGTPTVRRGVIRDLRDARGRHRTGADRVHASPPACRAATRAARSWTRTAPCAASSSSAATRRRHRRDGDRGPRADGPGGPRSAGRAGGGVVPHGDGGPVAPRPPRRRERLRPHLGRLPAARAGVPRARAQPRADRQPVRAPRRRPPAGILLGVAVLAIVAAAASRGRAGAARPAPCPKRRRGSPRALPPTTAEG